MNNTNVKSNTFCYDLPIAIGNKTFCGLTEKWTSRFNHGVLLAMTITPVLIYWLILFLMAKKLFKGLYFYWQWQKEMTRGSPKVEALLAKYFEKRYPNEKHGGRVFIKMALWNTHRDEFFKTDKEVQDEYLEGVKKLFDNTKKQDTNICGEKWRIFSNSFKQSNQSGVLFSLKSYFSLIILVLLKYFWDAIDLTLDVYIFYRLERGDVLDVVIYRNMYVINAIYGFAILGCLAKIVVWKDFCSSYEKSLENDNNFEDDSQNDYFAKHFITVASFFFEDGPELILEYFYIEKYITSYTSMIIVKDIMITCLLLYTSVRILQSNMKQIKESYRPGILFNIVVSGVTLASTLRVGGALYQYITKKLRRSCFRIDNGSILQTPFKVGCMRGVDYAILILVSISLCMPLVFMLKIVVTELLDGLQAKYRNYKKAKRDEKIVHHIPENSTLV